MGNLISMIMAADSPVLVVILSIALVYLLVKAVYDAGKWIIDRLNGYHQIKNDAEDKEQTVDSRITKLESHDKYQFNKLNEVCDEVKKLINMVQQVQDTQARAIVDTYRGTIFRIYHDVTRQGYINQTELDRFISLVEQYKKAGGNGIVDEKVYPEVMKLPIKAEKD